MPETKDEDAIVEAMARALCRENGSDPDYVAPDRFHGDDIVPNDQPRWKAWERDARRQYCAHLAMLQAMEKQGD